jgi:hypothetical protein
LLVPDVCPRLCRPLVLAVATAALVSSLTLVVGSAAADDERASTPDTVVGELVQAWPDDFDDAQATQPQDEEGLLSWVKTETGDSVRVATEGFDGITVGSTVEVLVGDAVADAASVEQGLKPAREVLDATVLEAAPAVQQPAAAGTVVHRVTVVRVFPAVNPAPDIPVAGEVALTMFDHVNPFWYEQSNGAVQLVSTAWPSDVSLQAGCDDPFGMWAEAAEEVDFDPVDGNHLLLYLGNSGVNFPDCADGLGTIGSHPGEGGLMYTSHMDASIIAHELGHNLGLGHASALSCSAGMEEDGANTCAIAAYDDRYDVMGFSGTYKGTLNAPHAAKLGFLPSPQQASVNAQDNVTRTYTLLPTGGRTGLRAIRLVDADGVAYWLEYRTATGQDAWLSGSGLQTGVQLRRANAGSHTSLLLDATPVGGQWGQPAQSALPVGQPVFPGAGLEVTVVSASASGAVVRVVGGPAALPVGNWESLSAAGSTLTVRGWAFDQDSALASIPVHVYVDGGGVPLTANGSRPDVGAAFAGVGNLHGFSWSGTVAPGAHTVCVYAIDVIVPSFNTPLGCRSIATQVTAPVGNWEVLSATGSTVTVKGWAYDPDATPTASDVHVYVDGGAAVVTANGSRPDVRSALGVGASHGFHWSGTVAPGMHTVCAYAIDADSNWRHTALGCRSIATQVTPPVAHWEVLSASGSTVTVKGWSFDPDATSSANDVHVYVDGAPAVVTANGSRPDVGSALGVGASHGFSWSGTVLPGVHTVCAWAIDVDQSWRNTPLGCRTITTQLALPMANWELLSVSGSTVRVKGWAIDPDDRTAAVPVHVYIDGGGTPLVADGSRPDVGSAFPGSGDDHGFDWSVSLAPGQHTVCVYAIDREIPSRNVPLGCRSVRTN